VVLRTPDKKGKPRPPIARVTVDKPPLAAPNAEGVDIIALPVSGTSRPVEVAADEVAGIESVVDGASPETTKLRTGLEVKLEKARKRLNRAQALRLWEAAEGLTEWDSEFGGTLAASLHKLAGGDPPGIATSDPVAMPLCEIARDIAPVFALWGGCRRRPV
jgi:hypothetical protein